MMSDPTTKLTFNWHELDEDNLEGFLKWMIPTLLSEHRNQTNDSELDHLLHRVGEASDKFTKLTMTIQLNGIEVNVLHFVENLYVAWSNASKAEATRVLKESTDVGELFELVETLKRNVKLKTERVGTALGLDMTLEEGW
jgi:hypothetical protein